MRCFLLALLATSSLMAENSVPRPEYPQPQFMRSNWLTLNGEWEFTFDDNDEGMSKHWNATPRKSSLGIAVPYCFESKLSGIADTGFHPIAWYSRYFDRPREWQAKHVLLHFGAVDYRAWVWLNGQFLGMHEGGNVPFSFDITAQLQPVQNRLTVRVEDPPTDKSIPRGKQYWELKSKSIFYTRTSGIWQPVWLEATGSHHLDRVQVTAGQDGVAHFEAKLSERSSARITFEVTIMDGSKVLGRSTAESKLDKAAATVAVAQPELWSPTTPKLYDVRYRLLQSNEVLDEVQSYLGFRTVEVRNGRVAINGQPVYLKFLLDQGYWPESILTPPSDEAIQRDIDLVQSMGFNGVRKHQKVEDPRFLYWADRRGLLVSGEIADAFEFSEEAARRFTTEWMSAVERDYNHPSIIIWNAINESWGVPDLKQPQQQSYLQELYRLTHALDNTRLAIDNEGWEHTDATDLFAIHDYEKSGETLYTKYKDVGPKSADVPKNAKIALLPGYHYNGSPLYLSEFGGIAYIPQGSTSSKESWGYSGVEKNGDEAMSRLTQLYEGLAKLPNMAGMCYTQLTDVEQEANGLYTYDRHPKFDAAKIKALNDKLR